MTAVAWTPAEVAAYWSAAYPDLRQHGAEWRGKCPLHSGRRDSFAVSPASGVWCCHSECGRGGSLIDFEMKRTGCSFPDALKAAQQIVGRPVGGNGSRRIIAIYSYRDECGKLLFEVCRYHPKSFSQRRPVGNGGWVWNLDGVERVLYNLPAVLKAGEVVVAEGERDADLLTGWGLTATTAPGGAGKWRQEYAAALRGRGVTILPDADRPGREHALKVAASLLGVADGVKIIELPGAKDVAEWAERGGAKEALMRLAGESAALTRESLEALRRRWSPDDSQPAESKTPEQLARETTFDSLATLSDIDYERRRRDVAAEFGIRVGAVDAEVKRRRSGTNACGDGPSGTLLEFPDPEPWPEPVNGAQVLDRIAEAVTRHVVLSPHCAEAVALWIMFAHCHDSAGISPSGVSTSLR